MLFEMLTGRVPFEGDNAVAVAMKQVSEPPPAAEPAQPERLARARRRRPQGARQGPRQPLRERGGVQRRARRRRGRPRALAARRHRRRSRRAPPPGQAAEDEDGAAGRGAGSARAAGRWRLAALAIWPDAPRRGRRPDRARREGGRARPSCSRRRVSRSRSRSSRVDAAGGNGLEQDPARRHGGRGGLDRDALVSPGPGTAEVPDVAGLAQREAAEQLEERGFEVETEQEFSADGRGGPGDRHRAGGRDPIEGGST